MPKINKNDGKLVFYNHFKFALRRRENPNFIKFVPTSGGVVGVRLIFINDGEGGGAARLGLWG